jgi:adenosylcobinamide-GDP ribazoletransferase
MIAALQFLTVLPLPVPGSWSIGERELRGSVLFFPLVGLLIGAGLAALDRGLTPLLPPGPVAVLIVMALLLVSGGLHLDGLADTADGFMSSRPRERILEIMKDSRSGPMAIAIVTCLLALKMTVVASLAEGVRAQALILMVLAGRCVLVLQMNALPYARPDGGLASVFRKDKSGLHRTIESLWVCIVLGATAWLLLSWAGLIAIAGVLFTLLFFSLYAYRTIGGFTGDTLGAGCEVSETMAGLCVLAWAHAGGAF